MPLSEAATTAASTDAFTDETSPVIVTKDFPPIPSPGRISSSSTAPALAAVSAATISEATEKVSIMPSALISVPGDTALIAAITCS
ncbi:hypothetical protein SDC9_123825 [bioreactor metagenome]|uniref:Uncharacterized protein n=1 Tax=bioreactor metagenome TaxID=1076179 RepID=A0A645CIQ1_9ZZZZ